MKNVFLVLIVGIFSAQITLAQNPSKGEILIEEMADQDPSAIAMANKYVFQDILNQSPELKQIHPADLQEALNQHSITNQQKARLARYFDGAIERSRRHPMDNEILRNKYENFMGNEMDASNPYYGFWAIMYNTMVAYQTMFFWPLAMMWGAPVGFGGMYP